MYEIFKRFKQFFIGLGVALFGMLAYIFFDAKRDDETKQYIRELSTTIKQLRIQLHKAENFSKRIRFEHEQLGKQFSKSTAGFKSEIVKLREKNERVYKRLSDKISETKSVISQVGEINKDSKSDIDKLRKATSELKQFIQENEKYPRHVIKMTVISAT